MTERADIYERELRDPALAALLRDSFAGDPALEESSGRTERIMRIVLASGVRPASRGFRWAPLGWVTAAASTAVLIMVLILGTVRVRNDQLIARPPQPQPAPAPAPAATPHRLTTAPPAPLIPALDESPRHEWKAPPTAVHAGVPQQAPPVENDGEQSSYVENDSVKVAAALYQAGSAARAAGDMETAYEAYEASYEAMPTPGAILASSEVLDNLAEEALDRVVIEN